MNAYPIIISYEKIIAAGETMSGRNIIEVKKLNQSLILRTLLEIGPLSRTALGEMTGLTPAAVSNQIAELAARGIVEVTGQDLQTTGAGRPQVLLDLAANSRVALGLEIGVSGVRLGLINLKGRLLAKDFIPHTATDWQSALENAAAHCRAFLHDRYVPAAQLVGAGIGVVGLVDAEHGLARVVPALQWRDLPVVSFLQDKITPYLTIENNVRLMALGEKFFGSGRNHRNLVLIHIGHGIGCGIIINGQIYRGLSGGGGELGHTTILPDGLTCTCGKRGCLETVAGGWGIVQQVRARLAQGASSMLTATPALTPEDIYQAAGIDGLATEVTATAVQYLGLAIANLFNLLNPEHLILSGAIWNHPSFVLPILQATLEQNVFGEPRLMERIAFLPPEATDSALIGAGTLALQKFFFNPDPV